MHKKGKINKKQSKGVTLIALVITIIVLLILAGVTINTLFDNGNAIDKAAEARDETNKGNIKEQLQLAVITSRINDNNANIDTSKLKSELEKLKTAKIIDIYKPEEDFKLPCTVTKDNYEFTIDKDGNVKDGPYTPSADGPTVIVGGEEIILTKENVKDYLGKVVTNFKEEGTGTETVNGYTVSTKYRLYYVDFDDPKGDGTGKYGDGVGTIYLKAECTKNNNYELQLDATSSAEDSNIRIKQLNPSLYASDVNPPTTTNENMEAVTWLLNENNWSSLKSSSGVKIANGDINYIVGAPSLEMMMDSYNTKYADVLKGTETPDYSAIPAGERRKLFYKYENGNFGYQVGPCHDKNSEYGNYTSENSVWTDSIDTMYYPGEGNYYWLSSPSAHLSDRLCTASYGSSGYVTCNDYYATYAFCPLVSLNSSVKLELEN